MELVKRGFNVQVKSGFRGPDLIINGKERVEVRTGEYDKTGGAFSFGQGTQIARKQFGYCICIGFPKDGSPEVEETLVFTIDELKEISKPSGKNVVRYTSTNPCILIRNHSKEHYLKSMKPTDTRSTELNLIRHPENYNRWDKIPKS